MKLKRIWVVGYFEALLKQYNAKFSIFLIKKHFLTVLLKD